jgi:hypothetical protein
MDGSSRIGGEDGLSIEQQMLVRDLLQNLGKLTFGKNLLVYIRQAYLLARLEYHRDSKHQIQNRLGVASLDSARCASRGSGRIQAAQIWNCG